MQNILKRIASLALAISLTLTMLGSILRCSVVSGYQLLGTNAALGSPILNDTFTTDQWNKWEMVVWGIFLSNFTTPFIDDYNSAFNLDSTSGSKGSGVKALQFGSGRDPANNKVIESLLNYAINQQVQGAIKQIYVSYTTIDDQVITGQPSFNTAGNKVAQSSTPSTDGETSGDTIDESEVAGESGGYTETIRAATVRDLFFMSKDSDSTWAFSSGDNEFWKMEQILYFNNYIDMIGIKDARVPTFAIKTNAGGYENVLDYTDGYDLSLLSGVLARGLNGDFDTEFKSTIETIFKDPDNYQLILDCFGNICTRINGSVRVIIPAAANKHLTSNPSINLVNSLVFNASISTVGEEQVIMNGGQESGGLLDQVINIATFGTGSEFGGELWQSGLPALTNGTSRIPAGSPMIFYDTDTIVYQKAIESGHGKSNSDPYDVHTGELYLDLFDLDITNSNSQKYAFKIEPANINDIDYSGLSGDAADSVKHTFTVVTQLVNLFNTKPDAELLTYIKTGQGESMNIFGDSYVVPVQLEDGMKSFELNWPWSKDKPYNSLAIHRRFVNYTYQATRNNIQTSTGMVEREVVRDAFRKSGTVNELYQNLLYDVSYQRVSTLFTSFINGRSEYFNVKDVSELKSLKYNGPNWVEDIIYTSGYQTMLEGKNLSNSKAFEIKSSNIDVNSIGVDANDAEGYDRSPFARSVKIYSTSETMRAIANILGVREGTEFAVWSVYIYLTYLDWYGITGSDKLASIGAKGSSKLNERIFDDSSDILNADINKVAPDAMTEEQKEAAILDWTYLMLNPTAGREYRSNMIISGVSDLIYDTYQRIVYGKASSYYDTGSGVTSRTSTGFLTVEPYADNFLTGWFISNYSYYAVIAMGIFLVLIIILGLIRRRKLSWFFVTTIVMVNMILILPSFGEVIPMMSNRFVQDMFSDKMSYWAISEGVTNATMEADYVSGNTLSTGYMTQLSKDEQQQVIKMVRDLNVLYLDRSICIRQDISKKVNQEAITDYDQLQQLRTARWMLPMLMRQFTANDGSANYVFIPLADKYEDLSNLYWYYKPADAAGSMTMNGSQTKSDDGRSIPYYDSSVENLHMTANRNSYFVPYTNTTSGYAAASVSYKQKSYDVRSMESNIHTYSYFINQTGLVKASPGKFSDFESYDAWASDWASKLVNQTNTAEIKAIERTIETVGESYDKFDRGTVSQLYGYLWATENPMHFFYEGIKDSFEDGMSLGYIVGELQGTYVDNGNGKEVHKTFMHADETGHVKDILDLEDMFNNMIPYLYSMQIMTAGYKDVDGVFKADDLIENYDLYECNSKSWLFRSNWVTKIMENRDFHTSAPIRLNDGTQVRVANMLLPSEYDAVGRPMIFSEAQMYAEGLTEADLSLIELKCVKINKDVSRKWILLLNYANTPGMTKEVFVRQMALDALTIFNAEFSPVGVINSAYSMYPTGIDLRSISFDSIMKMLMLNVTKNTSYIYGDTMQTLIEDADIFTALLLLLTSVMCVYIVPFVRNILMAAIFYLGLWAILWSILKNNKTKAKVTCGYIVSSLLVTILTFTYFLAFKTIMNMTATDQVLTVSAVEVNVGNPMWCLLLVGFISLAYIIGMYKMIQTCVANYRDMGFEMYAGIAELATMKLSDGISKLGASLTGGGASFGSTSLGKSIHNASESMSGFGYGAGRGTRDSDSETGGSGGKSKKTAKKSNGLDKDDTMNSSSHLDRSMDEISRGSDDSRSIDDKIKSGAKKKTSSGNSSGEYKASVDVSKFTDIESINRRIEHETRWASEYSEKINKHKMQAKQYNSEGRSTLVQSEVDLANKAKKSLGECEANIEVLTKQREAIQKQNTEAFKRNESIIDEL